MLHLKLINKFKKIIVDWKIDEKNIFDFNEYEQYLEKYINLFLINKEQKISFNELSKITTNLLDILFIFNYIENNVLMFKSFLSQAEIDEIVNFGFNPNKDIASTTNKINTNKGYIVTFQLSNKYPNIQDKVIRVNLNLLDKKYSYIKKAIYNSNLSSLVYAIDKTQFLWSELFINNQINKKDRLFARFTFDMDYKNLCERGLFWIEKTTWYHFINEINLKLADFYRMQNLNYHYSYISSLRKININLKNINFDINKIFIALSDLFMKINKNIYNKNLLSIENEINADDKKTFYELSSKLFTLLEKKRDYLKVMIYISNSLISPISDTSITK